MRIIFSSKDMELTEGLKTFIERKVQKFNKFASLGLSNLFITLNVDRKRRGMSEDAVVEIKGDVRKKTIVVQEKGKTFYIAFFGALAKLQNVLRKEKTKGEGR